MKNTLKLIGIVALAALIGFSFTSCADEHIFANAKITFSIDNDGKKAGDGSTDKYGVSTPGSPGALTKALTFKFSDPVDGKDGDDKSGITKNNVMIIGKSVVDSALASKQADFDQELVDDGITLANGYSPIEIESIMNVKKNSYVENTFKVKNGTITGDATVQYLYAVGPASYEASFVDYNSGINSVTSGKVLVGVSGKIVADGTAEKQADWTYYFISGNPDDIVIQGNIFRLVELF